MHETVRWKRNFVMALIGGGLVTGIPYVLELWEPVFGFFFLAIFLPGMALFDSLGLDPGAGGGQIAFWLATWIFWSSCLFLISSLEALEDKLFRRK